MAETTTEQIRQLADAYLKQALEDSEATRATAPKRLSNDDRHTLSPQHTEAAENAHTQPVEQDYTDISKVVDKFLGTVGLDVEKDSVSFGLLCREFLKAQVRLFQIDDKRNHGDYSDEFTPPPLPQTFLPSQPPGVDLPALPSALLSGFIESWIRENERADNWSASTKGEHPSLAGVVIEALGDHPVASYTVQLMREFKELLFRLPAYLKTKKQYREKAVHELAKPSHAQTLAVKTINKYLTVAQSAFQYAKNNG